MARGTKALLVTSCTSLSSLASSHSSSSETAGRKPIPLNVISVHSLDHILCPLYMSREEEGPSNEMTIDEGARH